ncbi:squalene/phytoene synthase family protein [endosymbiont of Ridgeia piscesae]|uniref:Farnesyl-diphosphate farnesyltransferase n=1 Tax=endosymbiont of Ridgeia piscesae TaxID=54398 RepID=A0A0T5YZ93_9GAMM|nr:squalene/phytoene synthase family protein [endosymbiont of Ridgeia piscesae]KRT55954.1 farnesyl-diphosphate farnesyltransferase [endosymbiont of Ridgeia piscesae]KRT59964.1 farnesyl-diphosphate farnesyltransferase [endosymbiont of Ridgeia piscesae]
MDRIVAEHLRRLVPPGSANYYAIRFSPRNGREQIGLLFAWREELLRIARECSDAGVAQARLEWWRSETANACRGHARHPLAQALIPLVSDEKLPLALFDQMATAMKRQLAGTPSSDWAELQQHARQLDGSFCELLARSLQTPEDKIESARQIGAYCWLVGTIHNLGWELRQGRYLLAHEPLQQYKLTPDKLLLQKYAQETAAFIDEALETAEQWRQSTTQHLERHPLPALRPGLNLYALAHRHQRLLAQEGAKILQRRPELSPLEILWHTVIAGWLRF